MDKNYITRIYTLPQLAEAFEGTGLSYQTIRRMALDGSFPTIRRGRRLLVSEQAFLNFLEHGDRREHGDE